MSSKLPRLGRGLEALIPRTTLSTGKTLLQIPLEKIRANTLQPREAFDETRIKSLSESIRQYGLIHPLLVRRVDDCYELVAGERRFRASQLAGLETVPVVIREYSDQDSLKLALIENLEREDLNAIEEAKGYRRLVEEFNLTHQELSEAFGKSRSTITNILRLLQLPESIQSAIIHGEISEGHARSLLALKDENDIFHHFHLIKQQGLNVREVERQIADVKSGGQSSGRQLSLFSEYEDHLSQKLEAKIQIRGTKSAGKIVIKYNTSEQFEKLYSVLNTR